ncbi:MAG: hypothetical protein ACJ711_01830 [Ornithinibacter sp.]
MNEAPTADGGPGFLAFLAFFLLAVALWFLMRNMNARMRRMSYRQQAAHRGKDDPQAGPGDLGAQADGPVSAPSASGGGGDTASRPVDPASGAVDEASGPDDLSRTERPADQASEPDDPSRPETPDDDEPGSAH